MPFEKGMSGNYQGRPKGSLNRKLQLINLLEPHAEQLVERVVELALAGDINALKICIDRLIPKAKYEEIEELENDCSKELKEIQEIRALYKREY